ncbi:MAG: AmpG family muropeptide MFS transporter [Proteobacteria bacterium]|nr:AmpG family muropeptide MFS transporter [Pseudomonadota bacterium]
MSRLNDHAILKSIFSRRMIVALFMGFASGLPLFLTSGSLIQAWMTEEGVDLSLIGLTAFFGLPYTLKFLWAPFLDRFIPPFLGRRRGWLLTFQVLLMISIAGLGQTDPSKNIYMVALAAFIVTFFSASQDIVADAYRREDLADEELGLGSSMFINGYRIGILLATGGGLILADHMSYSRVYFLMAACMIVGIVTTVLTPEPALPDETPKTLTEAIIAPLVDYFSRNNAILILTFILLYKIGDTMAGAITMPFYLQIGFSKTEVGTIVKLFGFWATIFGSMAGGILMLRIGITKSLWIFGVLQAVSTAGFALMAHIGYSISLLTCVITFENLSAGMGTSAYAAYMASITNKKFTATQYALLTSLMGVPRIFASAPTGFFAEYLGWENFFIFCTLIALPGMLLLFKIAPWRSE